VGLQSNQTTACPGQFTQIDVNEGPNTSTACACNCTLQTSPTCPAGAIPVKYDANFNHSPLACNLSGSPATMPASTSCSTMNYTGTPIGYQSLDLEYSLPGITGGSCSASGLSNAGNVTYSAEERVCVPASQQCNGDQCTTPIGNGLNVCIATSGSTSCPGAPFTHQHLVGGAATFTCSSTSCTCQPTGTCGGNVTLYTNTNCTGGTLSVPVDGMCHNESGAGSNTYGSYEFTASPPTSSCDPSGTSTAQNVGLQNEQTLCCTQ
jgi:hypothetical protein